MIKQKIDAKLLSSISTLGEEKKIDCFVFFSDINGKKDFLEHKGLHILDEYLFIKVMHCEALRQQIFSLSELSFVTFIASNPTASSLMYVSKKVLATQKTKLTGEGVTTAFIDTGVQPHCDFLLGKNRIKIFKDFIKNKTDCYDDNGHGTFVCGVCAGNGSLSAGKYCGIAPKSEIIALKALDAAGEASASKILDAMQWVYENYKKFKIKVVTMSFGSEPIGVNDPIMAGAEALWDEGVVVVAAAGNSGPEYQTIKSPGVSSKIITVGGIDDNRVNDEIFNKNYFEIANFSSRGPAFKMAKPDMVAPSVDIISCGRQKNYMHLSGTSVAAPMISGLCALLFETNEKLTPNQIKRILINSCQPLGFDMNQEGFGLPKFDKVF